VPALVNLTLTWSTPSSAFSLMTSVVTSTT